MTSAQIVQIEDALSLSLPSSYKEAVLDYPFPGIDEIRYHQFFECAELVIKENLAHRKNGWFNILWPNYYFIIGDDGCGNTFFMLSDEAQTIYCADHDGGAHPIEQLEECLYSTSLSEYTNEILEFHKEDQQLESLAAQKSLTKKWWQFWL